MSHQEVAAVDTNLKRFNIQGFPYEILLEISKYLTAGSINSLVQTNTYFQWLFHKMLEGFLTKMDMGDLTKLSWATANGYEQLVCRFLKEGEDPNELGVRAPHWTAIQHATLRGDLKIVNILLKAGANPNLWRLANTGRSLANISTGSGAALHIAAVCGHTLIVETLLKHGAKIGEFGSWWNTPLDSVITFAMTGVFHPYDNDNVLWDGRTRESSEKERHDIISILIDYGAEVNSCLFNKTPLSCAIERKSDISIVKLLLKAGAELCAPSVDWNRMTPLHCAVFSNVPDVVELLLDSGAELNPKLRSNGGTPLSFAMRLGYREIEKILISRGATKDDRYALACMAGRRRLKRGSRY